MRPGFRGFGLLFLLLVFVFPTLAQDAKDKKKDAKKPDVKKKTADDDDDKDTKDTKKKAAKGKEDDDDENKMVALPGYVECRLLNTDNGKLTVQTKQVVFQGGKRELRDVNREFEIADKVMVRIQNPPIAFDDKGQVKKYTKAELDEMKGENKKEFGYTAQIDVLKPNQVLRVFLGRPKSAPKTDAPQVIKIYVSGNGE